MPRLAAPILTIALCAMICTACKARDQASYPKRTRTPGTAVLPPTPNLSTKLAPLRYEDGTWSVHGVLTTKSELPSEGVQVKGYVAALHTCPERNKRCNPAPFVQLTDRENLHGRRLLVGGELDPQRDGLKIGKLAMIRGKFATRSADGLYFAPGGLLLFMAPEAPTKTRRGRRSKARKAGKEEARKAKR